MAFLVKFNSNLSQSSVRFGSVASVMSLEKQCDVTLLDSPSGSNLAPLTMLNVRKISGNGVQKNSGGNGILSVGIESLQVVASMKEENSRVTEKVQVIVKQKNDDRVKETVEINDDKSKIETVIGNHLKDKTELRLISLDEIAWHDTPDDCWFAIYDYVYDCTSFIKDHPGGDDVLLDYAGRDATLAFIGTGHSKFAKKILERYLIGELPPNERLFRIAGGVKVYGL